MEKEFVTLHLAEIYPYDNNPRLNDDAVADVIASIQQCENLDPIEIDEENVILSGHTRLKALLKLGYETTECVRYIGLTDEQKRKYRLLANKTGEKAQWDLDKLEVELADLDFDGFDFGFDLDLPDTEEPPGIVEDNPPEKGEPLAKVGDLWLLGKHRLICGDSTDAETVARLMDGQKADMLLTDPPYNVDYTGATKDAMKIANDNKTDTDFRQFLIDAFTAADSVMRKGAVFYIWHADTEGYNFRYACREAGWTVRECLIWNKDKLVLGRQDYHWKHEPCLYGWKDGASHLWASDRKQTTVLNFERPNKNDLHPTMKPIALISYQISNNTHENDAVLDLFGGSGSTLIACEQMNRRCYMQELDEKYTDVIIQRYINFKGDSSDVYLIRDGKRIPYAEVGWR